MTTGKLIIRGKHFLFTKYTENRHCATAKAAGDQFGTTSVFELVNRIIIGDVEYSHIPYTRKAFLKDLELAKDAQFGDTIIRILDLREVGLRGGLSLRTMGNRSDDLVLINPSYKRECQTKKIRTK